MLIDGAPESLVLGLVSNTQPMSSLITLVVAVFLSNFPEAMSSSNTMREHGMATFRIMVMWTSIAMVTFCGAGLGSFLFPPGSENNSVTLRWIAAIEGMCGGAMLTMTANTVLPEAFHMGGDVVGMSCLLGFLLALFVAAFGEMFMGWIGMS